jgi:hypothetical protein
MGTIKQSDNQVGRRVAGSLSGRVGESSGEDIRSVVYPLAADVRVSTKTAGNPDQAPTTKKISVPSPTVAKAFLISKSFPEISGQEPRPGIVKPSKSNEIFLLQALRFEFSDECRRKTLASASLPLNVPVPETKRFTIIPVLDLLYTVSPSQPQSYDKHLTISTFQRTAATEMDLTGINSLYGRKSSKPVPA